MSDLTRLDITMLYKTSIEKVIVGTAYWPFGDHPLVVESNTLDYHQIKFKDYDTVLKVDNKVIRDYDSTQDHENPLRDLHRLRRFLDIAFDAQLRIDRDGAEN